MNFVVVLPSPSPVLYSPLTVIFDVAASVEIGFAVQDISAFVVAIVHENVPNTAGTLAAYRDAFEVRRHVADNDILARPAPSPRDMHTLRTIQHT